MYKQSLNNLQKHIQTLNKQSKTTPKFEIKKWQLHIIRIFEFIFTTLFFQKRMLTKATIKALIDSQKTCQVQLVILEPNSTLDTDEISFDWVIIRSASEKSVL